jgi:hypothetical protein
VAQHRYRAASDLGKGLHVHCKGIDLRTVDFAAGEGARERVDADILRLDVAAIVTYWIN